MKQRFIAIRHVIEQRAKSHDNYSLNRIQRWFYVAKVIICILLNRKSRTRTIDMIDFMATWDGWNDYEGYPNWTELSVGHGCFRNWKYQIFSNGA